MPAQKFSPLKSIACFAITLLLTGVPLAEVKAQESIIEKNTGLQPTITPVESKINDIVLHAMSLIDTKYQYGGKSRETGFDCSGFVGYVYRHAVDMVLPHNAYQISRVGRKVNQAELQPGDLVFYNTLNRAFSHVGIYVGEDRFVHAPRRGRAVEIVQMTDRYWRHRYNGARRLLN